MMRATGLGFCLILCIWCALISTRAQGGLDQRVSELSQQIANKMSAKQKTTIAVVEFTDLQGNVTDFGRFLAEELITRLYDAERFKVIERQLLKKIIAEQKLSLTGVVDPTSAKQLGKILGVDAIVTGTITNLAQSLKVNARLISTETGEVFAVASTEVFKDESVMGLLTASSSSKATSDSTSKTESNKDRTSYKKVEAQSFTFELKQQCQKKDTTVICEVFVTNNDSDRHLWLRTRSYPPTVRIVDDAGREYEVESIRFGGDRSSGTLLVTGVPIKAVLVFDGVSPDLKKVTLLQLFCTIALPGWVGKDFSVQFK